MYRYPAALAEVCAVGVISSFILNFYVILHIQNILYSYSYKVFNDNRDC